MTTAIASVSDDSRLAALKLMGSIARTNVQLYNQLLAQRRPEADLALIRRAYDLTSVLYASAYQADGKPFVIHVVSVASTLALLGMPAQLIATALLHNVYNNADFGDGLRRRSTAARRRRVIDAVGGEVEGLIRGFAEIRLDRKIDSLMARIPDMNETEKALVTMDLADLLEKHLDGGALYFGRRDWVLKFAATRLDQLCDLADALQQPVMGAALRVAVADVQSRRVPNVLRSDYKYLHYDAPLSYWRRPLAALRASSDSALFGALRRFKRQFLGRRD